MTGSRYPEHVGVVDAGCCRSSVADSLARRVSLVHSQGSPEKSQSLRRVASLHSLKSVVWPRSGAYVRHRRRPRATTMSTRHGYACSVRAGCCKPSATDILARRRASRTWWWSLRGEIRKRMTADRTITGTSASGRAYFCHPRVRPRAPRMCPLPLPRRARRPCAARRCCAGRRESCVPPATK